ncbi:ASPM protein, partial [Smithornis capensis]|nr:ASPM protein [Smithornis capensis]
AARPARRRWSRQAAEEDADEDPVVLVLTYFSRPPFLSFGRLRVGASRTLLLGVENPNEEHAEVVIDSFPAAARGFSIEHRRFVVQSGQRVFVSVTWTPLEEGKVRELVTFVVNGIVKHQAVLLGAAEQPPKKKKSLWDKLKKKNSSETSGAIKVKKSTSGIKSIEKTSLVSQKVDKLRSPLQSCENRDTVQNNICPGNDPLVGSENQLPPSPVAPVPEESHSTVCTPLAMRRSTTFMAVGASVNEALLPQIDSHDVGRCVNEHSEARSEGASSPAGLAQPPISNNERVLSCSLSPVCTPEHVASAPVLSTRNILSPDTFVKGDYQVDIETTERLLPILSPDQFVKDILTDKQSKSPKPEAESVSSTTETCVVKSFLPSKWKKDGAVEIETHVHTEHNLSGVFEMSNATSQVIHDDKPEENHCSFPSAQEPQTDNCSQREKTKKRPILSATVVKSKRNATEETRKETHQPKSKKCLDKAIVQCANVVHVHTEAEISEHLPVIGPFSAENKCHNGKVNLSPTGSTSLCRKRKSETYVENGRVTAPVYVEEMKRRRVLPSSTVNQMPTIMRPSATNRERVGQRKKAGSSLQKTPKATKGISKSVPGLAQSCLTFVKPLKTVIPRHPMPFAAKNMFYDERWKEKQERGFTWWLNFVLTPDDFHVKTNTSQVNAAALILGEENQHKVSLPKAPTKDEASLRAYTARRKLNKLRHQACRLFTSEKMVKAIKKLEVEIETRRLLVRRDRHLWKDIGERQKVLNWLLSYNPLWLRIGLETIYGELIALESNSDVMGLAIFILNRLLWNPDIAAEYRHPTVPHLYREGHEEALSKFTLKKLLLLVCFLDCAKQSRMIDHDPCLFCKDAEFKASKDLLLAFSRDFLSGEGDLSRHLGFLGLPVCHVQTPLHEFDFAVTNLAVDLQCGIRLVRTVELLTKNWNLSKQLRVPAISRLQKMHNVDIVLNVLKERGVHLKDESGASIDSRDIVDRHRERTLALLWKIVFAFQVDVFLNVEQLKEEIEFLKNSHKRKVQLGALKTSPDCFRVQQDNVNSSPQSYSENVKLLMAWVNAVCGFYNIKVENFTVCFSDGRVLCHLIHHYHPCYVPLEAVCQRTTQTVECSRTVKVELNSSSSSESDTSLNVTEGMFDQTVTPSVLYKELLDNERKNFQLINAAVSNLGGIPAMIHHSDMSNTIPDEKVVITYLSFLCSRLLDLRHETRAARVIQSAWRNYRLKRELQLFQERDRAARVIQRSAMNFLSRRRILRRVKAAISVQKHWRGYLARMTFFNMKKAKLEEARNKSATVIQAYWRRYSARKRYLQLRYYVIFVQARIRMVKAVAAYKRIVWATVTIQRHLRASKLAKKDRQRYKILKSSALTIQFAFRRWRKYKIQQKIKATLVLQAYFRKWQSSALAKRRRAALVIQSWYRMHRDMKQYLCIKQSVIKIQAWYRCQLSRRIYLEHRAKIVTIQQHYRAYKLGKTEREQYLQKRAAVIVLQAAFRGMKTRHLLRKRHQAALTIQRNYWMYRQYCHYRKVQWATQVIQKRYRAYKLGKAEREQYLQKRAAVIVLQAAFRGMKTRHLLRKRHQAALKIQRNYRMYRQYCHYKKVQWATQVIQKRYRAYKLGKTQREQYLQKRAAVIVLQAAFRGMKTRHFLRKRHQAALRIQRNYRMYRQYCHYKKVQWATQVLQKRYRAYKLGKTEREQYLQKRAAVIVLQAAFRGMKTRHFLKKRHQAALAIQRNYRMYRQYCHYRKVQWAAQVIQKRYRANKLRNIAVQHYSSLKKAAICIQKAFRDMRAKKQQREMHRAATVLQKNFKAFRERQRYLSLKAAALVFQRRYRALILSRQCTLEYRSLRRAAVLIQAVYRGVRVKRSITHMHSAASVIQSAYRMHRDRRAYQNMRFAAIVIQNHYRSYVEGKNQRREYLTMKHSVLVIQASFRGMKARQKLKVMRVSAIVIQSSYRMYVQCGYYKRLCWAVRVTQQRFRAKMAKEADMKNYAKIKKAVICLQAAFRAKKARQLYKANAAAQCIQSFLRMCIERRRFLEKKAAAITIQSMFRCQRTKTRYQLIRSSAVTIQRWYRSCHRAHLQRAEYLAQRQAAVIIQSAFRGMQARKTARQIRAARKIQSFLQMAVQRRKYIQLRTAAIKLQAYYLMCKTKSQYTRYRKAAVVLQQCYRSHLAVKHQRMIYLQTRRNIIIVQARVRGFIQRKRFHQIKENTIKIQAAYRGYKARQWVKKMRAAQVIQTWFRGYKARKEYVSVVKATLVIQSHFRTKQLRTRFLEMKCCVLTIQRRWRATLTARTIHYQFLAIKNAAVKIQLAYRQYRARKLLRKVSAAVIIQKHLRAWQEGRLQFVRYNKTRRAVIKLQALIRGYLVRKKISEQKRQRRLLNFTAAAYYHLSVIKIQRAYRIHLTLKHLRDSQISSVLTIQRWFRAKMQQRRFRGWLNHRNNAATIIQRNLWRFLACRRRRKFAVGIIKFQALWRGYYWRKMNDTAKTKALRCRLEKANEESREENKLGNRTANAIEHLLKYKHFSCILAALKHLEVATSLSPLCCENMAQSKAICTIFVLIRSCNRSIPCMDVITYSVQVLLNVSKYERTTQAVYEAENSIDTLLDLLQMYRGKAGDKVADKGGSIFTKTCCLLAILSKDSKRALEIRGMPRTVTCIQSLYKLTARKYRMDAERALVRQKTNTILGGCSSVPVTPLGIKTVSKIKPDWFLRKDNMQEIVDPLQALQMVMSTLGIACH